MFRPSILSAHAVDSDVPSSVLVISALCSIHPKILNLQVCFLWPGCLMKLLLLLHLQMKRFVLAVSNLWRFSHWIDPLPFCKRFTLRVVTRLIRTIADKSCLQRRLTSVDPNPDFLWTHTTQIQPVVNLQSCFRPAWDELTCQRCRICRRNWAAERLFAIS